MIRDYTNIAANERTFLAWVRTGIAVIALGFVIERFNLFLLTIAGAVTVDAVRLHIHRLDHPAGRYGGEALIGAGVMLIVISTIRFIHTARLLARDEPYTARATSVSLYFLAVLLLTIAACHLDVAAEREALVRLRTTLARPADARRRLNNIWIGGDGVRHLRFQTRPG